MKKEDFRIVFMGTPEFAVASLSALVDNGFNVVGVITAPDKPKGRGKQLGEHCPGTLLHLGNDTETAHREGED